MSPEREKERDRRRERGKRKRECVCVLRVRTSQYWAKCTTPFSLRVCVFVCMSVWSVWMCVRERERERVCVCVRVCLECARLPVCMPSLSVSASFAPPIHTRRSRGLCARQSKQCPRATHALRDAPLSLLSTHHVSRLWPLTAAPLLAAPAAQVLRRAGAGLSTQTTQACQNANLADHE